MLRSGMMGWLTIMIDTNNWTAEQHAEAKREITLYKQTLRPLIRDANLYHVSPRPDSVHWDGIEYWNPSSKQGALYAFRGTSPREETHWFRLQGLDLATNYHLHFYDGSSPDRRASGQELMNKGVKLTLAFPLSSEIVLFEPQE